MNQQKTQKPCYRYNRTNHTPDKCKFKDEICHACSKKGHIKRACLAKKLTDRKKKVHLVDKEDNYSDDEYVISTLSTENINIDQKMSSDIILITPRVDGKLLRITNGI